MVPRRLYALLLRERRDILTDAGVAGAASPLLSELCGLLQAKQTFDKT